eukprot:CAMPEP_0113605442 /NCGR_PEP_ID=MMETSP0017_2-20120614/2331_1 /TAXON_ID=2856 /ORGANISM="Cylindrotheca closterium" /LENGTH=743 /DNA_ID=CAMNT_0000513935 /DNA_START=1382 /DNA_END=3613 /DNA_ORIENTATION=+ /assembly_acc=CAM_ASM_000147
MGGSCSKSRNSRRRQQIIDDTQQETRRERMRSPRSISRHSIPVALPDDSISNLYPHSANFIVEANGTHSPKSLAQLATDTLCRSLAYLDGELPPGLPQDVVDDIVESLTEHNALNETTIKVLRNCEISSLNLAGCRGVSDSWLKSFNTYTTDTGSSDDDSGIDLSDVDDMDIDDESSDVFYNTASDFEERQSFLDATPSSTSSSFKSAYSRPLTPAEEDTIECDDMVVSHNEFAFGDAVLASAFSNLTLLDLRGSHGLTDVGLRYLNDLRSLEVARFDNCHSIVGDGLCVLYSSLRLHTLSLANCRRLTDEGIMNISHLKSLEALSLDGCRCLTDRSVAAISGLLLLKKLDLSQCDLITDDGLRYLAGLEEIEELSLGWCRNITNVGIDIVTSQVGRQFSLRMLCLARCNIDNSGIDCLKRLEQLEELNLSGCTEISSSALGRAVGALSMLAVLDVSYCPGIMRAPWQGRINNVKSLCLSYAGVRDNQMLRFNDLPCLEELNLDSCLVSDWTIAHLAENNVTPNLVSLDLADTDLSDSGMRHLAKFTKLKRLSLFYCNVSNTGLRHLGQLTALESLNLDSRDIGDEGLYHLRHLKNLKALDIFSGRITDSGCSMISKIKSLESLELCGGLISDLGCAMLASLENLTSLNLSQNDSITDRGAAALSALSNLRALNLSNTRVTSSAFGHFESLTNLQSLALYGCDGLEDYGSIDRLQSQLPTLKCMRLNNGIDEGGTVIQVESAS